MFIREFKFFARNNFDKKVKSRKLKNTESMITEMENLQKFKICDV